MQDLPYKIGTIKLTWINPKDYSILESKMFNSINEALSNLPSEIDKNKFMLFQLIETDGKAYEWQLLPFGLHKEFIDGMKFRDNKLLYYGSMGLGLLGAYYLLKLIFSKK